MNQCISIYAIAERIFGKNFSGTVDDVRGHMRLAYLQASVVPICLADCLKRRSGGVFLRHTHSLSIKVNIACVVPRPRAPHVKPIFMRTSYSTCVPDRN